MRLKEISEAKASYSNTVQPLPQGDFSVSVGKPFALCKTESWRTRIIRALGGPLLAMKSRAYRAAMPADVSISPDLWAMEERFGNPASWSELLRQLPDLSRVDVLIPGCYMANEDVQFWLRRGVNGLSGIDIYSLEQNWASIVPQLETEYETPVAFCQGSIEDIPFDEDSFDVLVSDAVLEHVRNLNAMVSETHRVLKPGGYALHMFGPLYFSYSADHCIGALGEEHAYDHLLSDEATYRSQIDQKDTFEAATGNPELGFWAKNDQFSFATADDYVEAFRKKFELVHLVVKISEKGLRFRDQFPEKWDELLTAGVAEQDLLIKGMNLIVRKPAN